ncbi:hypothetical protein D515_01384 [Grimontia indica]|uniref:Uncharacterized protein n=1 Tax=Grimontia indica TaxID=1056512 RepID=R1IWD3_9GAMM|nr:hypothetical protein [Grimontia indica]EOD79590.1 hypothetical protein D515_01384 [Grimontia indica]
MTFRKYGIALALVSAYPFSSLASDTCLGNVYSMNAGRGNVGMLIDIKEKQVMDNSTYSDASSRATFNSLAKFSSPTMSFNPITNRLYYANAPQPKSYHVEVPEGLLTDQQMNNLDLHAKTVESYQLAYYDPESGEHINGPTTTKQITRMAFNPATGELFASDNSSIFKVNPETGEITDIGTFDIGLRAGGFSSWGDFIFHEGELLFITNGRTFVINTETGAQTLKAFHYVDFVTGAAIDQNGQVLITAKNQNVSGNVNSNHLFRLKPSTGETKRVGLFPTRISAMGTVTTEYSECYDRTMFKSDEKAELTGVSGNKVYEGSYATFTVTFDKALPEDTEVTLALKNGTALRGTDYTDNVVVRYEGGSSGISLVNNVAAPIPEGVDRFQVLVPTTSDYNKESAKTFSLEVWMNNDTSSKLIGTATILDDDEYSCGPNGVVYVTATNDPQSTTLRLDCKAPYAKALLITNGTYKKHANYTDESYPYAHYYDDWERGPQPQFGCNSSNAGAIAYYNIKSNISLLPDGTNSCGITIIRAICNSSGGYTEYKYASPQGPAGCEYE